MGTRAGKFIVRSGGAPVAKDKFRFPGVGEVESGSHLAVYPETPWPLLEAVQRSPSTAQAPLRVAARFDHLQRTEHGAEITD